MTGISRRPAAGVKRLAAAQVSRGRVDGDHMARTFLAVLVRAVVPFIASVVLERRAGHPDTYT